MGGPSVPFRYGRVDAMDPKAVTPDGRLPEADQGNPMATAKGLRSIFYRMGFNDQEIVALSGAHALGRCHADYSGYVGAERWMPCAAWGELPLESLLGAAYGESGQITSPSPSLSPNSTAASPLHFCLAVTAVKPALACPCALTVCIPSMPPAALRPVAGGPNCFLECVLQAAPQGGQRGQGLLVRATNTWSRAVWLQRAGSCTVSLCCLRLSVTPRPPHARLESC